MKNFQGINKKVFNNGLTLITEHVPRAKKVALLVGGMSGSVHEDKRLNGASHFNEHLLFKKNKHKTASEINRTLEYGGADINASTSCERTVFYAKTLPSELKSAVNVVFEVATNFEYDPEEFKRERGVILSEIKMGDEDHFSYASDRLFTPALFQGSPYEKSIAGTIESMGSVTKEELEAFKRKFYVPNNMAIVAVGNFDEAGLVKEVESTFAALKSGGLPPHDWSVDSENKAQEVMEERDVIEQIYLLMGSKIPIIHEDTFKLLALNTILSGGLSSRFFEELREKRGIGYSAGFFTHGFREVGMAAAYIAGFDPTRFDEAREVILGEFTKIQTDLVSDEEFRGRMNYGKSLYVDRLENVVRRSSLLLDSHLRGTPYDYRDVVEHMSRVTREKIREAANKYLDTQNYVLAAVVPKGFER